MVENVRENEREREQERERERAPNKGKQSAPLRTIVTVVESVSKTRYSGHLNSRLVG